MPVKKKFERLPANVKPVIYDLSLSPDLSSFSFSGKEVVLLKVSLMSVIHPQSFPISPAYILLQIAEATSKIVLNCLDLVIKSVAIKLLPDGQLITPDFVISVEDETLTLQFPDMLPVSDAELTIEFNGELNDKMKGFYRSKCVK